LERCAFYFPLRVCNEDGNLQKPKFVAGRKDGWRKEKVKTMLKALHINKRALTLVLAVMMAFSVFVVSASAAAPGAYTQTNYFYEVDSQGNPGAAVSHGQNLVSGYDINGDGSVTIYFVRDYVQGPYGPPILTNIDEFYIGDSASGVNLFVYTDEDAEAGEAVGYAVIPASAVASNVLITVAFEPTNPYHPYQTVYLNLQYV